MTNKKLNAIRENIKEENAKDVQNGVKTIVPAIYEENKRFKHYQDSVPNPNILFHTANTGIRVDTVQFYRMLVRKDSQFRTVVNVRKLAVVSSDWDIVSDDDCELTVWVRDMFRNSISSFRKRLTEMMDAIVTGYTVHEIITERDSNGNEIITDLLYRNPERFEFGSDGSFYLSGNYRNDRKELPIDSFLIHTNEATPENPYGESVLGEASFWLYYLKNGNWKDWAQFNERFGQGILKGEYDAGNIRSRDGTFEALKSLRSNGYAVFEKGSNIEILEASRNSVDYKAMLNEIDKAISRMVVGQELTTSSGDGSGSYALGKVHEGTFANIVMSDRKNLEDTINGLIRKICLRNFPNTIRFPRFQFVTNQNGKGD